MVDLVNVDISKIKQNIGSELFIEQDESLDTIEDIKLTSPISIKFHLVNIGESIRLRGSLKVDVLLQCSRCLEDFNFKLNRDFKIDLYETIGEKTEDYGGELQVEDIERIFYRQDNINLMEQIREQIILSLPIKPICQESCQGFCSHCGVNLNKTICICNDN
ncbi:MAG: DUF177 domain-containing protein [bacterium]